MINYVLCFLNILQIKKDPLVVILTVKFLNITHKPIAGYKTLILYGLFHTPKFKYDIPVYLDTYEFLLTWNPSCPPRELMMISYNLFCRLFLTLSGSPQ